MNEDVKAILQALLTEIEELRAEQSVTTVVLSVLPDLATTDLPKLKAQMLEKNAESYATLRQSIAEL